MKNGHMTLDNLRNQIEYQLLSSGIKEAAEGSSVDFYLSPGNWGDAMINQGTLQFFRYFDIRFDQFKREDFEKRIADGSSSVAIVGGGGGWCRNWPSTIGFVEKCLESYPKVVVLPTTFEIPKTKDGAQLFRRDRSMSAESIPESVFCHDMAFFLNYKVPIVEANSMWRLYAFRTDIEKSSYSHQPISNIDVSLLGDSYHSVDALFSIINRYKEIITDRLHVAIAGSLLGKKVGLLPGNYPKNPSVAASSLLRFYATTKMLTWEDYPRPGENFIF